MMNRLILPILSVSLLSACGAKVDDLAAFTSQVKQTTQVNIEKYPEFNKSEPVDYTASDLRSPFARAVANNETQVEVTQNTNCLQPNRNRQKSKLESYGIDALTMSGVFSTGGQKWALVKANDGTLHRITRGQYIGLFNGKVEKINDSQIIIQEMLPDGAGCWKKKQATMNMSSLTGENDNV